MTMKAGDLLISSANAPVQPPSTAEPLPMPKSPKSNKRLRPGWRPTIVRRESFKRLRDIQKSMVDPALDLSYLSDACIQIALDLGAEAIVKRALAELKPHLRQP